MRLYAKVSSQYWISESGRKIKCLGTDTQLIALYLLTNSHASMIGVYYLPISLISHETGIPYEGALKGLRSLTEIDFCSYDEILEYIWVHDMAIDQIGAQLKPNDNRIKAINETYYALPNLAFLQAFYDKYASAYFIEKAHDFVSFNKAPLEGLRSKEKKKEKEKKRISMSSLLNEKDIHNAYVNLKPGTLKTDAIEILEFLNQKTGKSYRVVDTNLKLIIARLKSGATVMDCRQVIAKKTREWKSDAKMYEYLRPATLFNATKFEQYMGELVLPAEETSHEPSQ